MENTDPLPSEEGSSEQDLFRDEALRHHFDEGTHGDPLRLSRSWTDRVYWLLVGVVGLGLLYLTWGTAPVYESGPAVLRIGESTPLASEIVGTIQSVEVLPGQEVVSGQVLVRFRADRERAQLAMHEKEFELQLLARLRDPSDEVAERELRRLRPELERAKAGVEQTIIVAPHVGTIQDVRIRPGDFLEAGDHLLSLTPLDPEYTAIAFLSGHALPQLEVGMPVRLKISGYPYAYLSTSIDSVGKQVIGPGEARRYVGAEIADAIEIGGPVVVVRCRLDQDRFTAGRQEYRLHDGMRGDAEVELRRERLLMRLVPGLKALGRDHG